MKNLYAIMIVLGIFSLAIVTIGIPDANAISGKALFMKANSTGKIYANFTFPVQDNRTWSLSPGIYLGITGSPVKIDSNNMTITVDPNSFTSNKENVTVTYTVTAKSDTRGVYGLFLFFCGQSPLIVGLNESNVNYDEYNQFFSAVYGCPAMTDSTPTMNIIGYYNIIPKIIDIDSNNTIKSVQTLGQMINKTQLKDSINSTHIISPLIQFKTGTPASDVKCNDGLQLILKTEDGSPACVSSNTAQILIERGWALNYTNMTGKESISLSAYQGESIETFYNNGTVVSNFTINVNIHNFKPSNALLILQVYYNDGTIYKAVNVSSDMIQPDGFYKYQLTAVSDENHPSPFKVVATYNDTTAITYAPVFAHP